jgi:hypothetical protein
VRISSQTLGVFALLGIFALSYQPLVAQNDEQLGFDFQIVRPFQNRYSWEVSAGYQTLLATVNKWRSFNLNPYFEASVLRSLDVFISLPMAYTLQKVNLNSYEITPSLGLRYHIQQGKRFNLNLSARFEQRYFYQMEAADWEQVRRTRLKAAATMCINGPNLSTDNLWYTSLDIEEFFVIDKQVNERFAFLRRARIGLGYRLNYKNRFEANYTLQSSRNEIGAPFDEVDNIFQVRYKLFLNPSKPQ